MGALNAGYILKFFMIINQRWEVQLKMSDIKYSKINLNVFKRQLGELDP